ncbi:DUF1329 domain-containing protein [Halopseudomonas phragmitis]|uniref:Outer membrane lipoprotein-sorting protein n=1 Tax=Halopseudomonas phragmitis TaxID=1931241 RepID=A0A1V0B969_9GAMM|nr:DUF1329 domain-containing protein [Halopseudomonas phragmitis]AQZ96475.1 outer membrane lipoprotein-sorting protein [Halopseudomonas phragmitis]
MSKHGAVIALAAAVSLAISSLANAAVSPEEAARLGQDLTCVGAERAGNADGSIPEFTGKYVGVVPGWEPEPNSGEHPVDPFADDPVLLEINASNYKNHLENLTDGQVAMFERYPETYVINVYQGRRDFAYPEFVCERAKWNALNAQLTHDGMGISAKGFIPFPIPKNGYELKWNHQVPFRSTTQDETRDIGAVTANGNISWGRSHGICLNSGNFADREVMTDQSPGVMAYCSTQVLLPLRERGNMSMNHEPFNWATSARTAWSYNTGTRRVRLAPGYGFDQPMPGSNGTMTIDEDRLFNGSPERYDWTLVGKREIYVPANAYKLNSKETSYDELLTVNHPNPEFLRYEKRRVWVLEAKLKPTSRHLYSRRVLFIDEDTWHGVMADNYDTRGNLWKHGVLSYYYHPDTSAWQAGTSFYHDLNSSSYVGYSMTMDRDQGPILNRNDLTPAMFTPDRLRAMGR